MTIPEQLKEKSFRFIKLKTRSKVPIEKDWQRTRNYAADDRTILNHIIRGGNVGIVAGYSNLRILDTDTLEFAEEISKKLDTFTIKTGSGGKHFYIISDYDSNQILKEGLGEFRAQKMQVVIPGSLHPNGNKYKVINDSNIIKMGKEEVQELLRPYLKYASRSEEEMAEVCRLIIQGISKESIFERMKEFDKWSNSPHQYRKRTYDRAFEFVNNNATLHVTNYIENVNKFYMKNPFFYDRSKIFWFWSKEKFKWEIVDDIDLMNSITKSLNISGEIISSQTRSSYLEAFKRVGRENQPRIPPKTWLQFRNKIYDISSGQIIEATAEYFITNPIPWNVGDISDTPTMDNIFTEWVGINHVETLYEILAYCLLPDYPLHRIFCLVGSGMNGKSKFLELLSRFVGEMNVTSSELDTLLTSRFEVTRLHKKLVCQMGETDFSTMKKTSMLKKLTGQDTIGFEYKNKDPFEGHNYAKILVATNNLPITEDKTRGFYRRWLIIDFPNEFTEKKDILSKIPNDEFNQLAKKSIGILSKLLKKREFKNEGTLEQREKRYEEKSNIVKRFIKERCEISIDVEISFAEFYAAFTKYCREQKHRTLTNKMVGSLLGNEGFERVNQTVTKLVGDHVGDRKTTTQRVIKGLKIKEVRKKQQGFDKYR